MKNEKLCSEYSSGIFVFVGDFKTSTNSSQLAATAFGVWMTLISWGTSLEAPNFEVNLTLHFFVFRLRSVRNDIHITGQQSIPVSAVLRTPLPPSNLYFMSIMRIHEVKKGPFHEHSSQLHSIAVGVPNWGKVNSGLFKMYEVSVQYFNCNLEQPLIFASTM